MHTSDVLIVGGGIVGLATAYRLTRDFPNRSVIVLEKNPKLPSIKRGTTPACCIQVSITAQAACAQRIAVLVKRPWSNSALPKASLTKSVAR